jgi:putative component of membrane protein insertase Oxa1/YidC/SpoIIIJ protein YidD
VTFVGELRATVDSLRQIGTYPSRAAISALLSYGLKHKQGTHSSKNACRASPDCAEYAIEAIARQGLVVGGSKGCWRALRCRFSSGELNSVVTDINP